MALALAVALWMAGAGCLLGCENMVAAAATSEFESAAVSTTATNSLTIVAAGDACASMHAHDCCATHGRKPAANSTSNSAAKPAAESKTHAPTAASGAVEFGASTMMDCPLAVNATAALSKAKPDTSRTALAHTGASARLPLLEKQAAALSPIRLIPNRGHTYLRCCVFLI